LLTLVLIPAVYTIMDDFQGLVSGAPRFVRLLVGWRPASRPHVVGPEPEHGEPEAPRRPDRVPVPVGGASN
jgi:hypothetical protein